MSFDPSLEDKNAAYPSIFRGREAKMNVQIIRFLALNGPSNIYSVKQHLSDESDTKVHYSTVNRRMHELLERRYLEKEGAKMTKAGVLADLYALGLRGEFAAFAGIPDGTGRYHSGLSPKETRQLISIASARKRSPLILIHHILQEGDDGMHLAEKALIPAIEKSVRGGHINIDAADEEAINSNFASLIALAVVNIMDGSTRRESGVARTTKPIDILMRALDKTVTSPDAQGKDMAHIKALRRNLPLWANQLRALLRLYSVKYY